MKYSGFRQYIFPTKIHLFGPSIRYLYFLSEKSPKMGRFHQNHHFDQYHHQDISLGRIEIAVSKNLLKIYERVKFTFGHLNKFLLRRSFLIKILRSKAVPRDQRFPTPKVDWVGLSRVELDICGFARELCSGLPTTYLKSRPP